MASAIFTGTFHRHHSVVLLKFARNMNQIPSLEIYRKFIFFNLNSNVLRRFVTTGRDNKRNGWRILFMGSDDFSLPSLKAINRNSKGNEPLVSDFAVVIKEYANRPNPLKEYTKIHDLRVREWPGIVVTDNRHEFDLGVVVSFGRLIPANVIQRFPLGMLNVHASLLPRWRGAAPMEHTILNGDTVTGITIMQITPYKFDVGRIVLKKSYPVPERITTPQLRATLAELGGNLLVECLNNLEENLKNSEEQDSSLATEAPKIQPSMAQLNFEGQSPKEIDRLHRAISHIFKLRASWHGTPVRLEDAADPQVMETFNCLGPPENGRTVDKVKPGSVVYHKRRKILTVLCKDGWAGFRSVQLANKATVTALEFYNGYMSRVPIADMYFTSA